MRTNLGAGPVIHVCLEGRLGRYSDQARTQARAVLDRAATARGLNSAHEISVVLCDGAFIRRLNRRWRDKDRATDVLSFPLQELRAGRLPDPGPIGDIVVALPVARRAARSLSLPFRSHLAHLLIHGLLHLLGYDHQTDAQAGVMERLERRLLVSLG
jgi:probable rRNA maturation factor